MLYRDLYEWLRDKKNVDKATLQKISVYERNNNCLPYTAAMAVGGVTLDEIKLAILDIFGMKSGNPDMSNLELLDISSDIMLKHNFLACASEPPEGKSGEWARVYICNPSDKINVLKVIKDSGFTGSTVFRWIPESVLQSMRTGETSKRGDATAMSKLAGSMQSVKSMQGQVKDINAAVDDEEANKVIQIVNEIITYAQKTGSSDIHIMPTLKGGVISYRIDGVLAPTQSIDDKSKYDRIMNRIKVLSDGIDETDDRVPQDGKIAFPGNDLRVSTIPTIYGESCVIRVLNSGSDKIRKLTELGYSEEAAAQLRRIYTKPNGIMLVSGPTGSGKSSTLAAITTDICTDEICLITIEEPVEYRIAGAVQSNVNPDKGNTFEGVLRASLRHDPDVIMIGEIRDAITARTAMQASNTGHLVFSTIHTNSAVTALSRLGDMGIETYLVCDNMIGIVSQSLLRKLCPYCKEEHVVDEADIMDYLLPAEMYGKHVYTSHKGGCARCHERGYSGRTCVYEIMEITDSIKEAMHKNKTNAEIQKVAEGEGFVSKLNRAYSLVDDGITSFAEVKRAIGGISVTDVKLGLEMIRKQKAESNNGRQHPDAAQLRSQL